MTLFDWNAIVSFSSLYVCFSLFHFSGGVEKWRQRRSPDHSCAYQFQRQVAALPRHLPGLRCCWQRHPFDSMCSVRAVLSHILCRCGTHLNDDGDERMALPWLHHLWRMWENKRWGASDIVRRLRHKLSHLLPEPSARRSAKGRWTCCVPGMISLCFGCTWNACVKAL